MAAPDRILILPQNFFSQSASNFLYDADYELLVKLFRRNNMPYSLIGDDAGQPEKIVNHCFELFAIPTIAYTTQLLQQNPDIISTSLNVLSDFFKARARREVVETLMKVRIIKETKQHTFNQYEYEGSSDDFQDFIKFVREDVDG